MVKDIDEYQDLLEAAIATEIVEIEAEIAAHPQLTQALERPIRNAKLREGLYYNKISELWVDKMPELINAEMAMAFERSEKPSGYDSIVVLEDRSEVGSCGSAIGQAELGLQDLVIVVFAETDEPRGCG